MVPEGVSSGISLRLKCVCKYFRFRRVFRKLENPALCHYFVATEYLRKSGVHAVLWIRNNSGSSFEFTAYRIQAKVPGIRIQPILFK